MELRLTLLAWMLIATPALARSVAVRDEAGLAAAIAGARAGDDIVLADGTYRLARKLRATQAGTGTAPITVRAAHPRGAHLLSSGVIAFEVTGPFWHFAGLQIRGACADDTDCEHAFHVVGRAAGFRLSDSRLIDFNAHLKVNADDAHDLPAGGLVENNEFFDTHPRHTNNPVAPVNIDNAVGWTVRGNLIHDFQKDGSGEGSYGAFVKGGSTAPVIERNVVICARDHAATGKMVGLSFGAHGMDANLCPPYWNAARVCNPEVSGGIIRHNIVASCSDDGIYVNKGLESKILSNTLVHTGGIEFRYAGSSGVARSNLMTGTIRATDGGHFSDHGNRTGLASVQAVAALVPDDHCDRPLDRTTDVGALAALLGACALLPWAGHAGDGAGH